MKIKIDRIAKSPFQVRPKMDGQPLAELKSSMSEVGQAVPIKVRPVGSTFEIVYGHRRLEAATQLGWTEIEAVVEEMSDDEAMIQGLAENIQRDDLEPIDEAKAYARLREEFDWSQSRIAQELGVPISRVQRLLRLLNLPGDVQGLVSSPQKAGGTAARASGTISIQHAEAIQGLDASLGHSILRKAASEDLSFRQTQQVVRAVKAAPTAEIKKRLVEAPYSPHLHDEKYVEDRVRKRGASDPLLTGKKLRPGVDWTRYPGTKAIIEQIKNVERRLEGSWRVSDEFGKLSPEAGRFVAERLRRLARKMIEWADELEGRHGAT